MAADDSVYFMRTSWPGTARRRARDPAIHAPLGLAKEDVDAQARRCCSRASGHDDWNRL